VCVEPLKMFETLALRRSRFFRLKHSLQSHHHHHPALGEAETPPPMPRRASRPSNTRLLSSSIHVHVIMPIDTYGSISCLKDDCTCCKPRWMGLSRLLAPITHHQQQSAFQRGDIKVLSDECACEVGVSWHTETVQHLQIGSRQRAAGAKVAGNTCSNSLRPFANRLPAHRRLADRFVQLLVSETNRRPISTTNRGYRPSKPFCPRHARILPWKRRSGD